MRYVIATRLGLDVLGIESQQEQEIFWTPKRPYRTWGSPSLLVNAYWGFFLPAVNRPGHDVDHALPCSRG